LPRAPQVPSLGDSGHAPPLFTGSFGQNECEALRGVELCWPDVTVIWESNSAEKFYGSMTAAITSKNSEKALAAEATMRNHGRRLAFQLHLDILHQEP